MLIKVIVNIKPGEPLEGGVSFSESPVKALPPPKPEVSKEPCGLCSIEGFIYSWGGQAVTCPECMGKKFIIINKRATSLYFLRRALCRKALAIPMILLGVLILVTVWDCVL